MPNLSDYLLPDGRYYFDNAATTKMSKEALKVYNETADKWFMNPMSYKDFDSRIDDLLNDARRHVIDFVGGNADTDRVIFTSGATESINLLLKGYFFANFHEKKKIITSKIEHKAVLETCNYLETIGAEVEYVDVTPDGSIDYNHLKALVDSNTLFVCLMHVNNETGDVSNIDLIREITKAKGVRFFTDTTQSIAKRAVNASCFDACMGSAHKFNGPKGIGFLFFKKDVSILPIQHGGGQERQMRAGTHNLPAILSMVSSLHLKRLEDFDSLSREFISVFQKTCEFEVVKSNGHILLISSDSKNEKLLHSKMVYSKGSACNNGLVQSEGVYKLLFPGKNILRISF